MATIYVIQRNDGSTWETRFKGEARLWAWMSMEFLSCNVYQQGGSMQLLSPFDIVL
jgi:hypothetical protein